MTVLRRLGSFALLACVFASVAWICARSSATFLIGEGWMVHARPMDLHIQHRAPNTTYFRARSERRADVDGATLHIATLGVARFLVDGTPRGASTIPTIEERQPPQRELDLDLSDLAAGQHEIVIGVMNWDAPAALRAWAQGGFVVPDSMSWTSSYDRHDWRPVGAAPDRIPSNVNRDSVSVRGAAIRSAPALLFLLAVGLAIARWTAGRTTMRPHTALWIALVVVGALWVRALCTAPHTGFDIEEHLHYVAFEAERGGLPDAGAGMEFFQPPLFYVLGALWTEPLRALHVPPETALRVLTCACGLAWIVLAHAILRTVFGSDSRQVVTGTFVAAFLPLPLYMFPYVGNEPLVAVLSAAALLVHLRMEIKGTKASFDARHALLLGLLLGLALLSKATAVVLTGALIAHSLASRRHARAPWKPWAARWGIALGVAFVIAGWFYVRAWIRYGSPFIGDWDPRINTTWWQEPGYRTWSELTRFGASLDHPIYSATAGFWDAIHSTLWLDGGMGGSLVGAPWHLDVMVLGAWTGLAFTALAFVGWLRAADGAVEIARSLSSWIFVAFLAALLERFLSVPQYSAVKATILLGVLPVFVVLIVRGLEPIARRPHTRWIVDGLLVAWALLQAWTYWS